MAAPDDDWIEDSELGYRRVPHEPSFITWDGNQQRWTATNAAFRDPAGGSELSIYVSGLLRSGEGPDAVASSKKGCVAFSLEVGIARSEGFGVTHRPDQDAGPLAHAHCNVNGDPAWAKHEFKKHRNALVRTMERAAGDITLPKP